MSHWSHTEALIDPDEAAVILGRPRVTVYHWMRHGKLPYVEVGRFLKTSRERCLEFMRPRNDPPEVEKPIPKSERAKVIKRLRRWGIKV